jgi:hypothetical protein
MTIDHAPSSPQLPVSEDSIGSAIHGLAEAYSKEAQSQVNKAGQQARKEFHQKLEKQVEQLETELKKNLIARFRLAAITSIAVS